MKRIAFIFGTRPEAIKLCPLVLEVTKHREIEPLVCVTGQHREMLDQVLEVFDVKPDANLALMRPNQTLGGLTSRAVQAIEEYLRKTRPDLVMVQGDTTTVFCAALAAFYQRIPVGHVEAGLRTWDKHSPYPEEINRVLTTRLADIHFAPTETSRENLLREGVPNERIHVTGNTVIDALLFAAKKVEKQPPVIAELPDFLQPGTATDGPRMVLITGHRRENFGEGFQDICRAISELARAFPEVHFVYPVHLNPNVREPVERILGAIQAKASANVACAPGGGSPKVRNVHLIEPVSYLTFVALLLRASLILTDSGGVQEEAPSLGKPVLVMRNTTERPEAVEMGTVKLVGTDVKAIIENVSTLLIDAEAYAAMANAVNPYGDGKACSRIAEYILSGSWPFSRCSRSRPEAFKLPRKTS